MVGRLVSLDPNQHRRVEPISFAISVPSAAAPHEWAITYTEGAKQISFEVFTSKDPQTQQRGRLPSGRYFIVKSYNSPEKILQQMLSKDILKSPEDLKDRKYWLSLYRNDGDIDNYTRLDTPSGPLVRSFFYAHFGEVSHGCITFRDPKEYREFVRTLTKVRPKWVDRKGDVHDMEAGGRKAVYGMVIVP